MQRRTTIILPLVIALGVAGLAYRDGQNRKTKDAADVEKKGEISPATSTASAKADSSSNKPGAPARQDDQENPESGQFHTMPDGSPIPALADSAPTRIKLGVALFRYQGAQGTSDSTRSRAAAEALAKEAIAIAKKDFAGAIQKGDRGSNENIGWMKQRVLERSVEYAVFNLAPGEVSSTPIDTPRGFWVAKRLR